MAEQRYLIKLYDRALAAFDFVQDGLNRALELYFGMDPGESGKLLSMLAFDSVIANKDRHFGNFGLLRDNRTGEALGTTISEYASTRRLAFCSTALLSTELTVPYASRRRTISTTQLWKS